MSQIISNLKDENQHIAIPGFYDDVPSLSKKMRQQLNELPFDDTTYQNEIGVGALIGEAGYSTLERRWFRPTLDCNGIVSGYIQEGAKTVIPTSATAKLSMRLVGKQKPQHIQQLVVDYMQSQCPKWATIQFNFHGCAAPVQVDIDHPAIQAAKQSLKAVHGVAPMLHGEGGSIPVVADFKDILNIDTILMGFNLPDDGIHAPNERMSLDCIRNGMLSSVHFLHECQCLANPSADQKSHRCSHPNPQKM